MKNIIGFPLLLFLVFTSCKGSGQTTIFKSEINSSTSDTIVRPWNVPKNASLMNLGFTDSPVYSWVVYTGNFLTQGISHNHIYEFTFWDKYGDILDTLYYEFENGRIIPNTKTFRNYQIIPYPGDGTLMLINSEHNQDTILAFNVLEKDEFQRWFQGKLNRRIPTIDLNRNQEKVSGYDLEINLEQNDSIIYTATILDDRGIKTTRYKLNDGCYSFPTKISFMDRTNGRIYFLQENCFLKPLSQK